MDATSYAAFESIRMIDASDEERERFEGNLRGVSAEQLLADSHRLKLAHTVAAALPNDSAWMAPKAPFKMFSELCRTTVDEFQRSWCEILDVLGTAADQVALIKGPLILRAVAPAYPDALSLDVDVVVKPDSAQVLRDALDEAGFTQEIAPTSDGLVRRSAEAVEQAHAKNPLQMLPYVKLIPAPQLESYEAILETFLQGRFPRFESASRNVIVRIDVHRSLHPSIDRADMFDDWQRLLIAGQPGYALGPTTLAWYVATRFYEEVMFHGSLKAKPLADLAALLRYQQVDFEKLTDFAVKYDGFFGALFYTYRFLKDFAGSDVPEHFLSAVTEWPRGLRLPAGDLGDFLPRLAGRRVVFDPRVAGHRGADS